MDLSKSLISICTRKIMFSRIRLLTDAPFYGMVMMNMKVYLGDSKKDVWIESGDILFFNPHYLKEVGDYELDKTIVRVLDEFVEQLMLHFVM